VTQVRKPRYGVQLRALEASPLKVLRVDAGSPAEKAGLLADDRIVQIDGRPIEELSVDDRLAALKRSPLQVTVERGDETLMLTMALVESPPPE
jgi:C-terminal processing protease CtpA/Prc